jgi:hypothetical protein
MKKIRIENGFVAADSVRWKEGVYKPRKAGER